jgi:hypothetical protein
LNTYIWLYDKMTCVKYKKTSDGYIRSIWRYLIDTLGLVRHVIQAVCIHIFLYRFKCSRRWKNHRDTFPWFCNNYVPIEAKTNWHLCLNIYIERKHSLKQQRSCIKTCVYKTNGPKCLKYCLSASDISQILWTSKCA